MKKNIENKISKLCIYLCLCVFVGGLISCNEADSEKSEPFYSKNEPPKKQEFRWSNGKMPKSFDPALASAPPESDLVRAIYEGLTELDANSLEPTKAIATNWKSSNNFKTWVFNLRQNAKWSNGETLTAHDFVKSWKRLILLGDKVTDRKLLKNIVNANVLPDETFSESEEVSESTANNSNTNTKLAKKDVLAKLGVEAIDNFTLKISLIEPDKDFPKLIAHPIFRPVYQNGKDLEELKIDVVTNGAFRLSSVGIDGITIDRSESYWNKENISLERVRFVPSENAEKALVAYKKGEVDAITNLQFEPLALKLLTPFEDFRRTTHNALNYYEFNRNKAPFNDVRVREALAIAIDRERLTIDEMDGATQPAFNFLPFSSQIDFIHNIQRAKTLLAETGFPNGENFPKIQLVINRNDMQKRIAKSVSAMWKKNLNIETEIIIKERADFENVLANGEFDVIRRGVVLPTTSETANMLAIFSNPKKEIAKTKTQANSNVSANINSNVIANVDVNANVNEEINTEPQLPSENIALSKQILTEEEATKEIPAIPLYFPNSYSMVKPYVKGFENNVLDAPNLKNVEIDQNWQLNKTFKKDQ
jgi:oligopeptide transport system substrate-binding protein